MLVPQLITCNVSILLEIVHLQSLPVTTLGYGQVGGVRILTSWSKLPIYNCSSTSNYYQGSLVLNPTHSAGTTDPLGHASMHVLMLGRAEHPEQIVLVLITDTNPTLI
jgi:hypothetical protein